MLLDILNILEVIPDGPGAFLIFTFLNYFIYEWIKMKSKKTDERLWEQNLNYLEKLRSKVQWNWSGE